MSASVPFSLVQLKKYIVINERVYDLQSFPHPGGMDILKPWFGHDGTAAFRLHHSTDILALAEKHFVGMIDASDPEWKKDVEEGKQKASAPSTVEGKRALLPPLAHVLNANDFRVAAEKVMDPPAWAYYDSGGDDELTLRENCEVFRRIYLRPRVMVRVDRVDTRCTLLGSNVPFPLYVTATALARLADPAGEVAIVRACHAAGNVAYMLPTLSSCSLDEMTAAGQSGQTLWFQLYVNPNRMLTADVTKKALALGCKALFVTVDAPQLGRRERDMRFKAPQKADLQKGDGNVRMEEGTSRALSSFMDPALCWDDLPWLVGLSQNIPLGLKGIQTGEDAVLAVRGGCRVIVVSNHGGRQLDTARSGAEALVEIVAALKEANLRHRCQIFVDGGVRRGTDIFKLLCMGADGVGIGRPVLHALASYGQEGVTRLLKMLQSEFEFCMASCGCRSLADINPSFLVFRQKM